jgi:hypothetical protein
MIAGPVLTQSNYIARAQALLPEERGADGEDKWPPVLSYVI